MKQLSSQEFHHIVVSLKIHDENFCIEAKHNFGDLQKIWETISALSNLASYHDKQYAYMIWWIEDKTWEIKGTVFDPRKEKRWSQDFWLTLESKLSFRNIMEDFEYIHEWKRLFILRIKSCGNNPVNFNDAPYIKVNSHNQLLNKYRDILTKILTKKNDRSWLPCEWTIINDLDLTALGFIKKKKAQITRKDEYIAMDTTMFLNQMSLLTQDWIPNNTCILFLWKQEIAERKLPAVSRFSWLYVDEKNWNEDRLTPEQQRSPLIFTIYHIIDKIQKYNMPLEDLTLFRSDTEYQYHEKAIEELIANSLAHRDREIPIHNEVRQTPISLTFSNPWRFDNDLEKVLAYSRFAPYKNQTMADFLSKINLMENERRGLQKVFSLQLSKWVFVYKEEIDNQHGGIVRMILDGKVADMNFAKLVFSRKNMDRLDMLLLQKIAQWENIIGNTLSQEQVEQLSKKWYIEVYWRSPNKKARVSYELLDEIGQVEKYILDKWIGTKKKEKLIIEYITRKWSISTKEIYKLFTESNKNSLRTILLNMKKNGIIVSIWWWKYILKMNEYTQQSTTD